MTEREFAIKAQHIFMTMENNQFKENYWDYYFFFISKATQGIWRDCLEYIQTKQEKNEKE